MFKASLALQHCLDVNYSREYILNFCLRIVRIFCIAKTSHFFPTKNNSVFIILTFEILTKRLTNINVNFEQQDLTWMQNPVTDPVVIELFSCSTQLSMNTI